GQNGFLAIDPQDVLEHDRPALVAGVQDQPARSQQQVLEHVVDLFVDLETGRREALEIAQNAVMVQQLVRRNFPVVELHVDQDCQVNRAQGTRYRKKERRVRRGLVRVQQPVQARQDVLIEPKQEQRSENQGRDEKEQCQ